MYINPIVLGANRLTAVGIDITLRQKEISCWKNALTLFYEQTCNFWRDNVL